MHEDLDQVARRVTELDAAVGSVRGEAYSSNGAVYVEVDLYGAITGLRLTEFAMERGAEEFARLVAESHERAHTAALANARLAHEAVRAQQDSRGVW
ncbi:hypothetical protein [Nocardia higoensis]|uniref:hypothetical protein n=1 Tax=Nocardia higoensis TaxID=228599 RepID=UPI00030B9F81|nr:hypothetical protein [Nocardia higoensis]